MSALSKLPFLDLRALTTRAARDDLVAALTVTFVAIPQSVAYAMIAGLPPVVGLYASFLPAIIGAIFRSSRHIITGPSNALSLLVGTGVAAQVAAHSGADPIAVALSTAAAMALMVGVIQLAAGALRLGVLVDYISAPVVAGYITGAGVLIGIGQLPNLTRTPGATGTVPEKVWGWLEHVSDASLWTVGVGIACTVLIVGLRKIDRRVPAPLLVLAGATVVSWLFDLGARGVASVADLAAVPTGLPALAIPDLGAFGALLPVAVAATVLSLVESAAVARTLAVKTGQRITISIEFAGQGLANVAAAVSGAYPTSASLARSTINLQAGAKSRLSGILTGCFVGLSLLFFGPAINHTPIAALAGLLFVAAADLVDFKRIRSLVLGRPSDAIAFAATVAGTWLLALDKAIYFGVAISLFFYLRRARQLRTSYLHHDDDGGVFETDAPPDDSTLIIEIDGQLFFAAVRELDAAVEAALALPRTRVLILRLRRAIGLDVTVAHRLAEIAINMRLTDRRLILTGVRPDDRRLLERTGSLEAIGAANVYERSDRLLGGLEAALGELDGEARGQ